MIDFRARPNTAEVMRDFSGDTVLWGRAGFGPEPQVDTLAHFVGQLQNHGIDKAVFTGRQMGPAENLTMGFSNEYVAECVASYPDLLIGFAGIDPTDNGASLKEAQHAVVDLGLSGISLDPHLVKITPDDRQMYPLYELADELKVPVVFTMGPIAGRWTEPNALDIVAEAFPNVDFVGSHACWPQVTELIAVAYRRPNVYLEASIYHVMPGVEPFIEAAKGMLQDQVIYASAFPFSPIGIIEKFKSYGFTDDVLDKVTHYNAAKVLGLKV